MSFLRMIASPMGNSAPPNRFLNVTGRLLLAPYREQMIFIRYIGEFW
jgi:hypothetical protein